jgi:hypothetical protein
LSGRCSDQDRLQQEDVLIKTAAIQEKKQEEAACSSGGAPTVQSVAAMKQAYDFTTHRITTGMDSLDSFNSFFG